MVSVQDSCFGGSRVRASAKSTFMFILFFLLMDSVYRIVEVYFKTHS